MDSSSYVQPQRWQIYLCEARHKINIKFLLRSFKSNESTSEMKLLTSSLCHDEGKHLNRGNLALDSHILTKHVERCCVTMKQNSPQAQQDHLSLNT